MTSHRLRTRLTAASTALLLVFAACGGDDDTESAADEPVESTTTTEDDAPEEEPTTTTTPEDDTPEPDPVDDRLGADPTAQMLDDKTILLDGFFGIRLPERWGVTSASPLSPSVSPEGGETALDEDALQQALVLNPLADRMAATLSLVHYTHSDSVPDLDLFTGSIVELLSGDGSVIGESQTATLGGQDARLHQVNASSGANGLMVTIEAGGEYFFIISLVSDTEYLTEASEMLTSVSMVPLAIR